MVAKFKTKKNLREDRIFQILFFILTLILIGLLLFSNLKLSQKRKKLTGEIESLGKEVQALEEKKSKLEAGISQTEKESYWEEKAREQGYVKEGENPVVIKQGEETLKEGSKSTQNSPKNLIEKIKIFFARLIQ